jgi:hypothetical protein
LKTNLNLFLVIGKPERAQPGETKLAAGDPDAEISLLICVSGYRDACSEAGSG